MRRTFFQRKQQRDHELKKERVNAELSRIEKEFEECCRTGEPPQKGFYQQILEDRPNIEDIPF